IIVVGLQDGSLLFLHAVDKTLQLVNQILVPKTTVDSPILRLSLRVNPKNRCQLAVAGSDGKLRLLELKVTVEQ
ncbi:hypothetical protein Angca_000812, partial [Angiostrongylus cantonensis]